MSYKNENWYALSDEQLFLQRCFLDTCQCAFKRFVVFPKFSLTL